MFNLADGGYTDQAALNGALGRLFGIRTGFHGNMLSNLARLRMEEVVREGAASVIRQRWEPQEPRPTRPPG